MMTTETPKQTKRIFAIDTKNFPSRERLQHSSFHFYEGDGFYKTETPVAQVKYPMLADYLYELSVLDADQLRAAETLAKLYYAFHAQLNPSGSPIFARIAGERGSVVDSHDEEDSTYVDHYRAILRRITYRQRELAVMIIGSKDGWTDQAAFMLANKIDHVMRIVADYIKEHMRDS